MTKPRIDLKHNWKMHEDIRTRVLAGEMQSHLAKVYGISTSVINKIVKKTFMVSPRNLSPNEELSNYLLLKTQFVSRRKLTKRRKRSCNNT